MSTILVLSDLHAHAWPRFSTTLPNGVNSRFQDLLNVLRQVRDLVDEHGPAAVYILGDLTHRRHWVHFAIYGPLMSSIADIHRRAPVTLLVGNHDVEAFGHHSLVPFRHAGLRVIDQPVDDRRTPLGPARFVPYLPGERVAEAVRAPVDGLSTLFLHYAFDGKALGSGEYAVPSPLRLSEADAFERIVLGHVHAPSVEQDGRVLYVGAVQHFDFGDAGPRYAWLLSPGGAAIPLSLHAPVFVTTTYPRIPVPVGAGFLRVLGTPVTLMEDVRREALAAGWLDVLPVQVVASAEAVQVLSAGLRADEQLLRDYVDAKFANLDPGARDEIVAFGVRCLPA